jgi:hypothetical protein
VPRLPAVPALIFIALGAPGCERACRSYNFEWDRDACETERIRTLAQRGHLEEALRRLGRIHSDLHRGVAVEVLLSSTSVAVSPEEVALICNLADPESQAACWANWGTSPRGERW